jgi:hypothetical protein
LDRARIRTCICGSFPPCSWVTPPARWHRRELEASAETRAGQPFRPRAGFYLSRNVAGKSAAGYSRLDTVDSSCATAAPASCRLKARAVRKETSTACQHSSSLDRDRFPSLVIPTRERSEAGGICWSAAATCELGSSPGAARRTRALNRCKNALTFKPPLLRLPLPAF